MPQARFQRRGRGNFCC